MGASKSIRVTCKGAMTLPIEQIVEFQGTLKKLTRKNLEKLKKRILEDGFNVPFFVWDNAGKYQCMDGHGRLKALLSLRKEGYDVPLLPVAIIEASDIADARKKLLAISSQYGEFDMEELGEWFNEMSDDVSDFLRLVDGEIEVVTKKQIDDNEDVVTKKELKPFDAVRVMLTMSQDVFFDNATILKQLKNADGVDYDQSQN